MSFMRFAVSILVAVAVSIPAFGEVCNLKVVTDANPDYYDLDSLVHSATSKWATPKEKCWAIFYWNHIARRQTQPIELHGMALTDPIRQFNDYGFTMCSTISGINQSIWEKMGLKHKYWDISNHTVCEVEYDGRYHMYDSSLSAIYTLCDGVTIAGVEDIGKDGSCAASDGKVEPGHIAKYHCLCATSPNGFLIGADTPRALEEEYRCFNPKGLKYRSYYYDWDNGHRYILNMKDGEVYTRYYHKLGDEPGFYVPNPNGVPGGKDPESVNTRYRIRGNGKWIFKPSLTAADFTKSLYTSDNIAASKSGGLVSVKAGAPASSIFKIQSANVVTSQTVKAAFARKTDKDSVKISISTDNGLHWKEVWKTDAVGDVPAEVKLVDDVCGAYEVLVKIELLGTAVTDAALKSIEIETITEVNSKTQPKLNIGKNTIYVGTGDQTDSIVFWPELQGGKYKQHIIDEKNIACKTEHIGYQGVIYPEKPKEDAYLVYKIDAPRDITKLTYGGRFYNRAPKSHIDMSHSFDGTAWTQSYTLTSVAQPWDVIHYETIDVPKGTKSVWVKYLMNTTDPSPSGCSIYALRMEADYLPVDTKFKPVEVTFTWKEVQADRSLVERSHAQLIEKVPFKYNINVGGADQPVMESLRINLKGAVPDMKYGYSDGKDVGGEKFVGKWVTYGKNIAVGKPYTCSIPSGSNWGAGDADGKKLTNGVTGPPYSGGIAFSYGATWDAKQKPVIILDLGAETDCASFGLNANGYPWWDAIKGEMKDVIEVLVSADGKEYKSVGTLKTDLRWMDLPVNHLWPDDETMCGPTYRIIPDKPVKARYVQYVITPKRNIDVTELEVLDSIKYEPFDMKIALPDEK